MAILKASCDYILMVDGDCLLPRNFVSRHKEWRPELDGFRWPSSFICQASVLGGSFDEKGLVFNDFKFRIPLGFLRDLRPTAWATARTCNLGVWRSDLYSVDGDESYRGWGKEDSDLVVRLLSHYPNNSGRLATCVHLPSSRKS